MTDPDTLRRIAESLERLAPPPVAAVAGDAPASVWRDGRLWDVPDFAPLALSLLRGVDTQKAALLENARRLAQGHAAHDVLLWGARGAGKSALIKSVAHHLQQGGATLWLVEVSAAWLPQLPDVLHQLSQQPRPVILFIDDLGFDGGDGAARLLRSILDGGASHRAAHVRLFVTSNRRHIVPRALDEQESAINPRDIVDDKLALVDRFGLSLGFHACDQDQYLDMVAGYAEALGLSVERDDALLWATQRGARSGRIAWHYAVELAGRAGTRL
jgi:uncharacterized protein